jgi:hypothetical protein
MAGRAACIAPNLTSFDLCDDAEGLDAGREVRDSVTKLYQAPKQEEPRKEEEHPKEPDTAEIPPVTEKAKTNGVVKSLEQVRDSVLG